MSVSPRYTFLALVAETMCDSRLAMEETFIQHGNTSCLLHSIAVAYFCYRIAKKMGILRFQTNELVRGALLHDYFLYDWHDYRPPEGLHGFTHPGAALKNARVDFELTTREQDIISKHMFPLTPRPPRYRESYLVSMVDKACSLYEVFSRSPYRIDEIQSASRLILEDRSPKEPV